MNNIEDTTRYTAPPDEPEPIKRYDLNHISRYVRSAFPYRHGKYRADQVAEYLRAAADDVNDLDNGL